MIDASAFKICSFKMAEKEKSSDKTTLHIQSKIAGGKYCCVVNCHRNSKADKDIVSFFGFPKRNQEQREKWIQAVKRINPDGSKWTPNQHSKICSDHFVSGWWSPSRNDPDYVPSKFGTNHIPAKSEKDVQRFQRYRSRSQSRRSADDSEQVAVDAEEDQNDLTLCKSSQTTMELDLAVSKICIKFESLESETLVSNNGTLCHKSTQFTTDAIYSNDVGVQTALGLEENLSTGIGLDFDNMAEQQFVSFTGITKNLFNFILDLAEEEIKKSRTVTRESRLALFLVKLKLNPSFSALGGMFKMRAETAALHFADVLGAMVKVARTGVIWYSKDKVRARLPPSFKSLYPETRIIIDCSEIPCETPSRLKQRTLLYSNYKSRHTLKFLVGCAPSGEIMFISETFGGRTTDTEATIKSGLITLIEENDAILADKGFPHIEGGVNSKGGVLVMPPFKEKQRQFSTQDNKSAYDCASVRVHIERCIARMKVFSYLKFVRLCEFKHIDDVLYVISYLCNMGNDLIKQD